MIKNQNPVFFQFWGLYMDILRERIELYNGWRMNEKHSFLNEEGGFRKIKYNKIIKYKKYVNSGLMKSIKKKDKQRLKI